MQYKRINEKAAIVLIGEVCQMTPFLLDGLSGDLRLGRRPVSLYIEAVYKEECSLDITDEGHYYTITEWLPFNQQNHTRFERLETLSDKIEMLESLLTGNILSMAKGLGIFLEDRIVVKFTSLFSPSSVIFKGIPMKSFSGSFVTNIELPSNIGLGKGASIGHGTISESNNN